MKLMTPRIAILLETSLGISRDHLSGVLKYIRLHGTWTLDLIAGGLRDQNLDRHWKGHGIIARLGSPDTVAKLASIDVPKVLIDPQQRFTSAGGILAGCPQIANDYRECGTTAAEYLLDRGFKSFAFVGPELSSALQYRNDATWPEIPNWSSGRWLGFSARIAAAGHPCTPYPPCKVRAESLSWERERPRLIAWLRSLPKPVAVYVSHDPRARQVLDACQIGGFAVPYQVAVLGTNDDPVICETTNPPLSSIRVDSFKGGYLAAELLDGLLHGKRMPRIVRYGQLGVRSRASTDQYQTNDAIVIAALEQIRLHRGFNLRLTDIAEHVGVSARWLQKRFKACLGRSVGDISRTTLLNNVMQLVRETDMSMGEITELSGQRSASHLAEMFRNRFGATMSSFRKQNGGIPNGTK